MITECIGEWTGFYEGAATQYLEMLIFWRFAGDALFNVGACKEVWRATPR